MEAIKDEIRKKAINLLIKELKNKHFVRVFGKAKETAKMLKETKGLNVHAPSDYVLILINQ